MATVKVEKMGGIEVNKIDFLRNNENCFICHVDLATKYAENYMVYSDGEALVYLKRGIQTLFAISDENTILKVSTSKGRWIFATQAGRYSLEIIGVKY